MASNLERHEISNTELSLNQLEAVSGGGNSWSSYAALLSNIYKMVERTEDTMVSNLKSSDVNAADNPL